MEIIRITVYNGSIVIESNIGMLVVVGKSQQAVLHYSPDLATMTHAPILITLDTLMEGKSGTVIHIAPSAQEDGVDLARRLMELGFVPGERIRMLKRGMPGGDPLAIKVGNATFALRRFEAALISIQAE